MMTQPESRYVNQILYREWYPPVYLDMHQMGNSGARLFLPPYVDPVNPNIHPVVIRSLGYFGQKIAMQMTAEGLSGILTDAYFNAWWQGGFLKDALYHNIIAILSEMASANIASPIFQKAGDLEGNRQGFPEYRKTTNFPAPWKGGWWRLRDILAYDQAIVFNLLKIAAQDRQFLLFNFYRMGRETVERGKNEPPFAALIPHEQRDTSEMRHLLDILLAAGVRVNVSTEPVYADGRMYPVGTFIIRMDQPNGAYAKSLLERQEYPDLREENASLKAVNLLLARNIPVYFAKDSFAEQGRTFSAGSIIVPAGSIPYAEMLEIVDSLGVRAEGIQSKPPAAA